MLQAALWFLGANTIALVYSIFSLKTVSCSVSSESCAFFLIHVILLVQLIFQGFMGIYFYHSHYMEIAALNAQTPVKNTAATELPTANENENLAKQQQECKVNMLRRNFLVWRDFNVATAITSFLHEVVIGITFLTAMALFEHDSDKGIYLAFHFSIFFISFCTSFVQAFINVRAKCTETFSTPHTFLYALVSFLNHE